MKRMKQQFSCVTTLTCSVISSSLNEIMFVLVFNLLSFMLSLDAVLIFLYLRDLYLQSRILTVLPNYAISKFISSFPLYFTLIPKSHRKLHSVKERFCPLQHFRKAVFNSHFHYEELFSFIKPKVI